MLCLLWAWPALGCDICAVYTGYEIQRTEKGLRLGLGEQFTRFTTLQLDSVEVPNPYDEHMNSSITQFLLGYQFNRYFGAQIVVPVIARNYRRLVSIGAISGKPTIQSGDVSGFGDLSLLATALLYNYTSEDALALVTLLGGLELPSGNSSLLGEEVAGPPPSPLSLRERVPNSFSAKHTGGAAHVGVPSGIHGHDLALGSGAVDGIFGLRTFGYFQRFYADAAVQYFWRGSGSFDYEYNDLFTATGGPGYFVLSDDDYTLGAQALMTVETKGKDSLDSIPVDDTGYTGFYVGPAFQFTWSTSLSADLAADFPAIQNNTGLQIVPDWRVRFGAVWRW